jgi:hypothetical protein
MSAPGHRTLWWGTEPGGRTWTEIADLSWTADGRTLAFLSPDWNTGPQGNRHSDASVRTIDTTGPGGSLADSRIVLHLKESLTRNIASAIISPDGSRVDVATLSNYSQRRHLYQTIQVEVMRIIPHPGHPRLLYLGALNASDSYLRTDGFGHLLLADDLDIGWLDHGRLHPLPPGDGSVLTDVAW